MNYVHLYGFICDTVEATWDYHPSRNELKYTSHHERKKEEQTTGTLQERSVAVDGRINGNRSKKGNKRTYKKKVVIVCCGGSPWCWAEGSGSGCVCVELYAVAVVGVVIVVVVVVVVSCLSRWCLPLLLVLLWSLLWL